MATLDRLLPTPDYQYHGLAVIRPRGDYKAPSLHTRALSPGSAVKSVDAEWCPVCLGREISERLVDGSPFWHCNVCGNEW